LATHACTELVPAAGFGSGWAVAVGAALAVVEALLAVAVAVAVATGAWVEELAVAAPALGAVVTEDVDAVAVLAAARPARSRGEPSGAMRKYTAAAHDAKATMDSATAWIHRPLKPDFRAANGPILARPETGAPCKLALPTGRSPVQRKVAGLSARAGAPLNGRLTSAPARPTNRVARCK
jgi:hypothetical protein